MLANVSGDADLTTANGKMIARIKGAVARQEADPISERTGRQKAQALADGRPLGGRFQLFGCNRDWTVKEDEAAVVVPPESWRASLCGFPVGGRGVLVVDRAHHARRAVTAVVVVEPVAPVQHDGLGLPGVLELVA